MKVEVIQSCPTLCDPMDYTVPGILQARILKWVAFPFSRGIFPTQGSNPSLWHCRWIFYQLSHKGSPRILEWVAYIPSPMDLPDPGIKPGSPALQADSLTIELSEKTNRNKVHNKCNLLDSFPNHPPNPGPWKYCLQRNWSLVPNRLVTAALEHRLDLVTCFQHIE